MHKTMIILAAALLSSQLQAASVMKCVDAAGKVTFTQNQNCPRATELNSVVSARNAAPSGSSARVQMADPKKPRPQKSGGQSFVVVGAHPPAPHAPVSDQAAPRGVALRASNQPCIKTVDQPYSYSRINKKGNRVGGAGIRKVVVPC